MTTQEQLEEFKEAFDMFDMNGDGAIAYDEVKRIIAISGYTFTDAEIRDILGIDATFFKGVDRKFEINFEEFVELMTYK